MPETTIITIVGSAATLKAARRWLDEGQPGQRHRGRKGITLRVEPIRNPRAQTADGAGDNQQAVQSAEMASLVDA